MRSMHQRGRELALAKFFHNVHLIDISNTGEFCHQLDPTRRLTLFLNKKIMDMLIAQGLDVDTFPFCREAVIGGFSMLKCFRLVNVERNGTDV